MLEQIGNYLWLILQYSWDGFTWIFHAEERMAMQFDTWGMPLMWQMPILVAFNALLIAIEIAIYSGLFRFRKTKEPKTPRLVLKITRGKPIGPVELMIMAFVPWGQKFGCFVFATQRKYFGLRGYIALCIGGTLRLVLVVFLPKELIWVMIIGMLVSRLASFWLENGRHALASKREGKK
jgi:hypothetical protein